MNSSNSSHLHKTAEEWLKYCLMFKAKYGCNVFCIIEFIFGIITGATLPIYLIVIFILIRYRKELNSSFFIICISAGFADILYITFKYCFQVLPSWFWFEKTLDNIYLATIAKIGHWGVYYTQVFGVCLMVINRYSAICFPMTYTYFWTNRNVALAIIAQWLLPLPLVTPMIISLVLHATNYKSKNEIGKKMRSFRSEFDCSFAPHLLGERKLDKYYELFSMTLEPAVALLILILHVLMVIKQWKHSNNSDRLEGSIVVQNPTDNRPTRVELRLAFTGFVITILYSTMVVLLVIQYLNFDREYIGYVFYYISDIFTSINPFLLIGFSHLVRKYFFEIICFWKNGIVEEGKKKVNVATPRKPRIVYDSNQDDANIIFPSPEKNVDQQPEVKHQVMLPSSAPKLNKDESPSQPTADFHKNGILEVSLRPIPRRKSTEPAASPSLSQENNDIFASRPVSRASSVVGVISRIDTIEPPPSPHFVFRDNSIESWTSKDDSPERNKSIDHGPSVIPTTTAPDPVTSF